MRGLLVFFKWLVVTLVVAIVGVAGWLWVMPPELIRVGAAYSAKIVCSNVFIAKRNAEEVLAVDVQAPGHPLLKFVKVETSHQGIVKASLLGLFGTEYAVYRPGLGCANVPDQDTLSALKVTLDRPPVIEEASPFEWPLGDEVTMPENAEIKSIIMDPALQGPGMRAIVVVRDGRIIAETYGEGFDRNTPLLGWSMTKTVTASLLALRVQDGALSWGRDQLMAEWNEDSRAKIKLSDVMAMQDGLEFNEDYGDVADVTRMLFLEPDQPAYAASRPASGPPGQRFNYSTGSAVLASEVLANTFDDLQTALDYPRKALFGPIGMRSAVFETDSRGNFSGGSLIYATARDWARFGLLLANDGVWNDTRLLPADFMTMVQTPTIASKKAYTGGFAWKDGPRNMGNHQFGLPDDTYWALGHDGQSIAIMPAEKLVVVRMGLTPSRLHYLPQNMISKIIVAASKADAAQPDTQDDPAAQLESDAEQ